MMRIIVEGPQGAGKSHFIHGVLVDALRKEGIGARFYFEGETEPSMFLSGPREVEVVERQTLNNLAPFSPSARLDAPRPPAAPVRE